MTYEYNAENEDEVTIKAGDTVEIVEKNTGQDGWWKVTVFILLYCTTTAYYILHVILAFSICVRRMKCTCSVLLNALLLFMVSATICMYM